MSTHNCQKMQTFPKTTFTFKSMRRKKRIRRKPMRYVLQPSLWKDILAEDMEIEHYLKKKENEIVPSFDCESKFVKENLFPTLIPAFQRMCAIVLNHSAHTRNVRFFNFLDFLAEIVWNTNAKHPERQGQWMSIYRVYENEQFYKSRPFFAYRLFLTLDEAATIIQARMRGFLTRIKYDLGVMKIERDRILAAMEKQRQCFNAYKDIIGDIRDCVCEGGRQNKRGYGKKFTSSL